MPLRRPSAVARDPLAVLHDRILALEAQVRKLRQSRITTVQVYDTALYPDPTQGESLIHHWTLTTQEIADELAGLSRKQHTPKVFHDGRWRSFGDFVISLSEPDAAPVVKSPAFHWAISRDLDGARLQRAEAFLVTAGSGATRIRVNKNGANFFVNDMYIDSGAKHSTLSSTPVGINNTNSVVWRDEITIDVLTVGTGALGLGVVLGFA